MTTAIFSALFVPTAVSAAALGVAAYRLCRDNRPICWRCCGTTDAAGSACKRCREQIHAERKRRMGRCVDGSTGYPLP